VVTTNSSSQSAEQPGGGIGGAIGYALGNKDSWLNKNVFNKPKIPNDANRYGPAF
jgi:hypothetical protein